MRFSLFYRGFHVVRYIQRPEKVNDPIAIKSGSSKRERCDGRPIGCGPKSRCKPAQMRKFALKTKARKQDSIFYKRQCGQYHFAETACEVRGNFDEAGSQVGPKSSQWHDPS